MKFDIAYSEHKPKCESLRTTVYGILKNEIEQNNIACLPIQSRVKSLESAKEKQAQKRYNDPIKEMTDAVGFRVIVYLSSDIKRVEDLIRAAFDIDESNSINKREPVDTSRVGYRSQHLIGLLGPSRSKLPEYAKIFEIKFEVQIRTILEHAWAEIEHKQNYKASSKGLLPKELERRLMILAGTLELVDNELAQVVQLGDEYRNNIAQGDEKRSDDPLNRTAIEEILIAFSKNSGIPLAEHWEGRGPVDVLLQELRDFGVKSVLDFRRLSETFPTSKAPSDYTITLYGTTRDFMILADYRRFFADCFHEQFLFEPGDLELYRTLSGESKISNYIQGNSFVEYAGEF